MCGRNYPEREAEHSRSLFALDLLIELLGRTTGLISVASARWQPKHLRPCVVMAVLTRLVVLNLLIFIGASLAMDWSGLPCTANDVHIEGSGVVLNEPCYCPEGGSFTALIQFTIINSNSATRSCFTLQLCQAITLNGHTIPGGFIALNLTQSGWTASTYVGALSGPIFRPLSFGLVVNSFPLRFAQHILLLC